MQADERAGATDRTTRRKEGRSGKRSHDSKRGGMSNKERQTDGGNRKTKRQDDKNKACKRDRNERRTWDETVKWRGWKDLEYKRRKHTKRCNGNSKRKNSSRIMRRQQGARICKKRRFNGSCKGVKRKNGWIEN